MLDVQYRMHPSISAFPSKEFYNETIKDGTISVSGAIHGSLTPPQSRHLMSRRSAVTGKPPSVLFIDHSNPEATRYRSRINVGEGKLVAAILEDLLRSDLSLKGSNIGVISPYIAQTRLLENMLKDNPDWEAYFQERLGEERANEMKNIDVKTVDGFEGQEKDVIILSTVRNNSQGHIGFLADRRRMNVALTRAKRALFVLGRMETLASSKKSKSVEPEDVEEEVANMLIQGTGDEWRNYIKFVVAEKLFIEMDLQEYRTPEQTTAFEDLSHGEIATWSKSY